MLIIQFNPYSFSPAVFGKFRFNIFCKGIRPMVTIIPNINININHPKFSYVSAPYFPTYTGYIKYLEYTITAYHPCYS